MDHLLIALMNLGVSDKNIKSFRDNGETQNLYLALGHVLSAVLCVGALMKSNRHRSHRPKLSAKQENVLNGVITAMKLFLAI